MDSTITAPSGVTIDVNFYAISDIAGVEAKLGLKGMKSLTHIADDGGAFVLSRLPPVEGGWRLMTDDEVKDYEQRQDDDEDED